MAAYICYFVAQHTHLCSSPKVLRWMWANLWRYNKGSYDKEAKALINWTHTRWNDVNRNECEMKVHIHTIYQMKCFAVDLYLSGSTEWPTKQYFASLRWSLFMTAMLLDGEVIKRMKTTTLSHTACIRSHPQHSSNSQMECIKNSLAFDACGRFYFG